MQFLLLLIPMLSSADMLIPGIAPVSGPMGTETCSPKRPVPVMHFHGTWPGQDSRLASLGAATKNVSANDLMWEFFKKHPMK